MMEVLVRGNKIDITDAMKDYVKEKLSKLDKYTLDGNVKANVLVKVRNYTQKVEVTIPLKTLILRAEEESEDFYSAVDLVINKLERQIRKNKTKLKKKEKSGIKEFNIDDIIDLSEENEVVKRKKIEIEEMKFEIQNEKKQIKVERSRIKSEVMKIKNDERLNEELAEKVQHLRGLIVEEANKEEEIKESINTEEDIGG